jgi:hypothetical protein
MTDTITTYQPAVARAELVASLRARDGDNCQFPACGETLNFEIVSGRLEPTIDHWIPQWKGKAEGWTKEEIWDISNLKLMHKKCNAKKGDLIPNDDGTLPERPKSTFRYRRDKRANRADEPCQVCDNGHNLAIDEVCAQCGMNAQRFPRWAKVSAPECDHEIFWCWWCSITPEVRPSSVGIAMRQAGADEFGEELNSPLIMTTDGHVGVED